MGFYSILIKPLSTEFEHLKFDLKLVIIRPYATKVYVFVFKQFLVLYFKFNLKTLLCKAITLVPSQLAVNYSFVKQLVNKLSM